jgi:ATP-dependent DNA ligase
MVGGYSLRYALEYPAVGRVTVIGRRKGNRVLPCGERGLEGIMAKRKESRYLPGRRSENWLKIKTRVRQEAAIRGITEPSEGRHYFGASMLGVYDKGRPQYVDHTGTGFSEALLKGLFGKLTPHFTDRCPFMPKPKANAPDKWVERGKTGAAVQELLQALNGSASRKG